MAAIRGFAQWLASAPDNHGEEAYRRARNAVIDTVGCALAGSASPPSTAVQATLHPWGPGRASIVGSALKAPAPLAALANGTAAHALDLDDCDHPANSHPSAALVPALLALAEERDLGGHALLDAYIAGLEVLMRIGEAVNLAHYHRGWHATSTLGAIGAAAASARLLRLDAERCGHALSLASSMAGGFQSQFGTMAKPLHAGLAAQAGVLAASLAESGLTGAPDTLDGERSLLTLMSGEEAPGFDRPLTKLGEPLAILEHGLLVKRYPCCSYTHRAIDGLLELKTRHGLTAAQVERITVRIPGRHTEILPVIVPETPSQARFSMPYCLAAALHGGGLVEGDFISAAIARPEVRETIALIDFAGLPISHASSDLAHLEADSVVVRTKDGREHAIEVLHAKGDPKNPLGEDELLAKFESCAARALTPKAVQDAKRCLLSLSEQASLDALMRRVAAAE